jgi:Zn-dependent M28 family amino/carboxypeptidase
MRKNLLFVLIFIYISLSAVYGQLTPVEKGLRAITPGALKAQLGFLASDWTEGRMAGEKGESLSADYIASLFQLYGIKHAGDLIRTRGQSDNDANNERSYFQNFVMLKTIAGEDQILRIKSFRGKVSETINLSYNVDFFLRPSDPATEIEAPVVFVGYGIRNEKLKYNDFNKLDVKGKFVLKLSGYPKFFSESLSQEEIGTSIEGMETSIKDMGAVGIIEFSPKATVVGYPEKKDFSNLSPAESHPRSGRPIASYSNPDKNFPDNMMRIYISVKAANEILKGTGINLDEYINKADINELSSVPSFSDKSLYVKTSVTTTQISVKNILGIIEGNDPEQVIVMGAHYDHMGTGNGYIWNGADDNGSGTVGVLTLAKAFMESGKKPDKTLIFALWTAEEEGLLGSKYYVEHLPYPLKNLRLNVNFDMISRYISEDESKKVTLTYTNTCPEFKEITNSNLNKFNIDLIIDYQPSSDPPGGTDHRSFVAVGVPILRFKPGHREEYHTPKDEPGTVDWDIMEKIVKISFANVWELANTDW